MKKVEPWSVGFSTGMCLSSWYRVGKAMGCYTETSWDLVSDFGEERRIQVLVVMKWSFLSNFGYYHLPASCDDVCGGETGVRAGGVLSQQR